MEKLLKDILKNIESLHEKLNLIDEEIKHYGRRLDRLEKMDSIEHRVTVNQIDLTDIKEIVEKVAEFQRDEILDLSRHLKSHLNHSATQEEINLIHKRLDVQLNKIAKNEEAILIVGSRN